MPKEPKSFHARARAWTTKNKLHGPSAFPRFVMMAFVERLNQTSDEFIFKGGNLLWLYIKTPRATVDVDFVTKKLADHDSVRKSLEAACSVSDSSIIFSVKTFVSVDRPEGKGAEVTIAYKTTEGQENTFDLDVVYAVPSATTSILSPLTDKETIVVVTMENIVADKLSAAHRYGSGNTRMKDFDDLWRIAILKPNLIKWPDLNSILASRSIAGFVDDNWITTAMGRAWQAHVRRNPGLPADLRKLMQTVNEWLRQGLG